MVLSRLTPCQKIEIWQPRLKDRTVLIAKYKVGAHNEIVFTKTKSMPNSKIECYSVPINKLELLESE